MSFTRRYLVCSDLAHAAFLDSFALEYLRDTRGVQAAEWSGIYVRDDGTYGVEWESPLTELLGPIEDLPVVDEIITNDESDWQKLPPPDPEPTL